MRFGHSQPTHPPPPCCTAEAEAEACCSWSCCWSCHAAGAGIRPLCAPPCAVVMAARLVLPEAGAGAEAVGACRSRQVMLRGWDAGSDAF